MAVLFHSFSCLSNGPSKRESDIFKRMISPPENTSFLKALPIFVTCFLWFEFHKPKPHERLTTILQSLQCSLGPWRPQATLASASPFGHSHQCRVFIIACKPERFFISILFLNTYHCRFVTLFFAAMGSFGYAYTECRGRSTGVFVTHSNILTEFTLNDPIANLVINPNQPLFMVQI